MKNEQVTKPPTLTELLAQVAAGADRKNTGQQEAIEIRRTFRRMLLLN